MFAFNFFNDNIFPDLITVEVDGVGCGCRENQEKKERKDRFFHNLTPFTVFYVKKWMIAIMKAIITIMNKAFKSFSTV